MGIIVILFVLYICLSFYVINEISCRYPELYEELGKPTRFILSLSQMSFLYLFILLGEYRLRKIDNSLKILCFGLRIIMVALHIIVVISFISASHSIS